jgi:transcriptional regulator with XRE-family HTH domain
MVPLFLLRNKRTDNTSESARTRFGAQIRKVREARGLSLRELAEQSGLSLNAISRIERAETSPTVSSLHRLATALSVQISEFFDSGAEQMTMRVPKSQRLRSRNAGMLIESLGSGLPGQRLEPFLMTLLPGAHSGDPVAHGGEEFVFCVEGDVEYVIEEERYRLEAGDSLLFKATQSHLCRNTGLEKAVVLFVIQAPDREIRLSQQRHLMTGSS